MVSGGGVAEENKLTVSVKTAVFSVSELIIISGMRVSSGTD
jgi:hypothetical protein